MRRFAAVLVLLAFCGQGRAQTRVSGQAFYRPYDKIVLKAENSNLTARFLWDVTGDCQVEELGAYLYVWAAPGSYKVVLTAIDFETKKVERARFSFTVGGDPPGPTPPGPGPNPPVPADPFFSQLKAAYDAEAGPTKAADVAQLAALYRAAAQTTVRDQSLTTAGAFFAKFKAAVDSLLLPAALPRVRPAIGANLGAALPRLAAAPLDDATRSLIAAHYNRIAADLEALR